MSDTLITPAEELRLRLHGELFEPGSAGYADACTLFNAMVDRRPRHVARCVVPEDVVAALAFARDEGLPVAVRAGGHSVAGHSLIDDGLVLDVRAMADVEVDPVARIARVGGGATWAAVDHAAAAHGLVTTGGRVSTTGVAGLTLGGGSGWLERAFGLACDNLVAAELVTASGELVRASEEEHPELLWALRGGGHNFGVVTALELRLHPAGPDLLSGLLLYPASAAGEVLRCLRDQVRTAEDAFGFGALFLTGPDEAEVPAHLRGEPVLAVAGVWAGADPADGERALAPLRALGPDADWVQVQPYTAFQSSLDDPPGYRNWWTAVHLADFHDAAIDAVTALAADMPAGPSALVLGPWGGAVARVAPSSSPLAGRDTAWVVHPLLLWEDAADDARVIAYGRRWREVLAPWAEGAVYLNFIGDEGRARVRAGYLPGAYERLAELKAQWDPGNLFRGNQNIRPAASRPATSAC